MAGGSAAGPWMLSPVQWWLVTAPMDLRGGMDRLLVHVRTALGRDPFDGSAYVFRNRSGSRLKVLYADAQGIWLCARRLHEGHFIGAAPGSETCTLSAEQFAWLCAGVDWRRLSQVPPRAVRI